MLVGRGINMAETVGVLDTDTKVQVEGIQVIAALSQQLGIAECEVGAIYTQEFARIAAQARIRSYVPILALHNTQARLMKRGRQASAH
jgi:uncharacterized protein (DUF2126 family)